MTTHLSRLQEVFDRLRRAGLKLKPEKCHLFKNQVNYLGHVVDKKGVSTDPAKIKAVEKWPRPQHKIDVRAFLETTSYYRKFIPNYAEISKPLTALTGKHALYEWNQECQRAFELLKDSLIKSPVLAYPDFSLTYLLDTDASE